MSAACSKHTNAALVPLSPLETNYCEIAALDKAESGP